jgi:hypothetical protein
MQYSHLYAPDVVATALKYCIGKTCFEAVKLILHLHPELMSATNSVPSPLLVAFQKSHLQMFEYFFNVAPPLLIIQQCITESRRTFPSESDRYALSLDFPFQSALNPFLSFLAYTRTP